MSDDDRALTEKVVALRLTPELAEMVEAGAKRLGLTKAALMRLAIERGVAVVLGQLARTPACACNANEI